MVGGWEWVLGVWGKGSDETRARGGKSECSDRKEKRREKRRRRKSVVRVGGNVEEVVKGCGGW